MKGFILCSICIFLVLPGFSQTDSIPAVVADTTKDSVQLVIQPPEVKAIPDKKEHVYKIKPAIDIPIVVAGTGWSVYAFSKLYTKGASTEAEILSLRTSDINAFDRSAVRPYSKSIDRVSYYPFYIAMPLPFVFLLTGKKTRSDFLELSFLYWETMSVTGLFGTGATYFVDRYRPYTYNNETPMDQRRVQNSKNSFYSGHVEVVAASTFFIAKVYADYYPNSKMKWVFYGVATAATAGMGYLRYEGGMHFPSDILLGSAMGALAGILVPHFHKHKLIRNPDLSIMPYTNDETKGFILTYRLK